MASIAASSQQLYGNRFYFQLTGSSRWRLFVELHLIYGLIMKGLSEIGAKTASIYTTLQRSLNASWRTFKDAPPTDCVFYARVVAVAVNSFIGLTSGTHVKVVLSLTPYQKAFMQPRMHTRVVKVWKCCLEVLRSNLWLYKKSQRNLPDSRQVCV